MKILAVETSAKVASVAVLSDGILLGEYTVNNKMTHSETLMPMIDRLLSDLDITVSDIDLFAASVGPGSYTGLRIGVATVTGLASALDKKVIGIGTLEALAYRLPHAEHLITPIMDARRGRVYTATYIWEDGKLREVSEPDVVMIEACVSDCGNYLDTIFTGDAVSIYKEQIISELSAHAYFATEANVLPSAASVAALAYKKCDEAVLPSELAPVYIGRSQVDNKNSQEEK